MHLVFFITALLAYLAAPLYYSQSYCACLTSLFLIQSIILLKRDILEKNYLNFNLVFLFSFFMVTYVFPTFIVGTDIQLVDKYIERIVDYKYITRAVALSHLAITSFFLAFILRYPTQRYKLDNLLENKFVKWKTLKIIYLFSFFAVFLLYLKQLIEGGGISVSESPFLYDIYRVVFVVYLTLSTISKVPKGGDICQYFKYNKICLLSSGLFLLLCLLIGDRGPIFNIVLIIVAVYLFFVRKIKIVTLISIGLVAVVLMFSIRETRTGASSIIEGGISAFVNKSSKSIGESAGILTLFADLTGISSEMTVGYEYVQKHGITYPMKFLQVLFSPLPMFPSIISELTYSKTPVELSSGYLIGSSVASIFDWHCGTHCVMDIYIHWGEIGVVIVFFLFGRILCIIEQNKNRSLFYMLIYIILISIALYIPRSSVFDFLRPVFYVFFFMKLFVKNKSVIINIC